MSEKIDAEKIKNWIKDNLDEKFDQDDISSQPAPELSMLYSEIAKLSESGNLKNTPLKEVVTGKKHLRKIRKILQKEIIDWSLSPFLDKQTYYNSKILEILKVIKWENIFLIETRKGRQRLNICCFLELLFQLY